MKTKNAQQTNDKRNDLDAKNAPQSASSFSTPHCGPGSPFGTTCTGCGADHPDECLCVKRETAAAERVRIDLVLERTANASAWVAHAHCDACESSFSSGHAVEALALAVDRALGGLEEHRVSYHVNGTCEDCGERRSSVKLRDNGHRCCASCWTAHKAHGHDAEGSER